MYLIVLKRQDFEEFVFVKGQFGVKNTKLGKAWGIIAFDGLNILFRPISTRMFEHWLDSVDSLLRGVSFGCTPG